MWPLRSHTHIPALLWITEQRPSPTHTSKSTWSVLRDTDSETEQMWFVLGTKIYKLEGWSFWQCGQPHADDKYLHIHRIGFSGSAGEPQSQVHPFITPAKLRPAWMQDKKGEEETVKKWGAEVNKGLAWGEVLCVVLKTHYCFLPRDCILHSGPSRLPFVPPRFVPRGVLLPAHS